MKTWLRIESITNEYYLAISTMQQNGSLLSVKSCSVFTAATTTIKKQTIKDSNDATNEVKTTTLGNAQAMQLSVLDEHCREKIIRRIDRKLFLSIELILHLLSLSF